MPQLALRTSITLGYAWIIDGRTQWVVLSAAIDKRRSAGCMGGTESIVQTALRARRGAFRKLRSDSSGLFSRPKRELCAVAGTAIA